MSSDTISEIVAAIEEVESDDSDDQLCASFKVSGQETPWIQVVSGILNVWWPFDDDPAARVTQLLTAPLPGWVLCDWEAGTFATFEFEPTDVESQAETVDLLFRTLYDSPPEYTLDIEVYVLQDEEIPDTIPIRREAGYHTDQIGSFRDGQFMGFVVATLPATQADDSQASDPRQHVRWYAVLHQFDSEGNYIKTDHWFAGATADGKRQVVDSAQQRLSEMLDQLEGNEFEDVRIRLFSTTIDGHEFGLVDATREDEESDAVFVQAELLPNQLVFHDPWDGTYDT